MLSDDEDDPAAVSASPAAVARGATRSKGTGTAVLGSLEQLKEDKKKKRTDDIFASLNGGAASASAASGAAAMAAPLRYRCGLMAQVRAGFAMDSAAVGPLKPGEVVTVLETKRLPTGVLRCRIDKVHLPTLCVLHAKWPCPPPPCC